MKKIRESGWREVELMFENHGGLKQAKRNIDGWASLFGVLTQYNHQAAEITLESWAVKEIKDLVNGLGLLEPRMLESEPPRLYGLPLVVCDFGNGHVGMIDGKHRANNLKGMKNNHAVIRIRY